MDRTLAAALSATTLWAAACRPAVPAGAASDVADGADLIVVLVVDQLKATHLERWNDAFTGGLRRLLDEGAVAARAVHDHAGTYTSPGHATLATGVHPARHGIVENVWRERREDGWASIYSVADTASPIVGEPDSPGRSPARLLRDGLADWVLAADAAARVVSISGKDRASILLASRAPGYVYWFHEDASRFVTSRYYAGSEAPWVASYNAERLPDLFADRCWRGEIPATLAPLANGVPERAGQAGFQHCAAAGDAVSLAGWVLRTPFVDVATLELAAVAVTELELGRRGATDFLALSLSQPDRIGHRYGPWSPEQLDNLLRLDRGLGEFLAHLDREVGAGRYVLGVSSDHGVLDLPERLRAEGHDAARTGAEWRRALAELRRAVAAAGGDAPVEEVAARLGALDFVAQVIPRSALESAEPADSFTVLYRRSYHAGRETGLLAEFDVEVRMEPHILTRGTGTTHGSPYLYDRRVPLIFLGRGVVPGALDPPARTVDLAPTLARLAGVPAPPDLDGEPLIR